MEICLFMLMFGRPKTLNKEQRLFFNQMKENENFIPSPEKGEKSFFEKVKDMFSITIKAFNFIFYTPNFIFNLIIFKKIFSNE